MSIKKEKLYVPGGDQRTWSRGSQYFTKALRPKLKKTQLQRTQNHRGFVEVLIKNELDNTEHWILQ